MVQFLDVKLLSTNHSHCSFGMGQSRGVAACRKKQLKKDSSKGLPTATSAVLYDL